MFKKKYHGGLKVLLFPLFIILLGMFSTCHAGTTLIESEAEYIWNYNFTSEYSNLYGYLSGYSSYTRTMFNDYTEFMTFFNENNTLEISVNNTWFIVTWQGNNWGYIDYYNFNNTTASDSSPYLTINFPSGTSNPKIMSLYAYDDTTQNYIDLVGRRFKFQYSNNRYNFSNMTNNTLSKYGFQPRWYNFTGYTGANEEFLFCIPGICALGKQPLLTVYSNISNPGISTYTWYFYETNREFPVEPVEPSGDIATGGTGTITNNSGDTTGKIDLSGIEQGIGNIQNQISGDTQKVIENQNQNTDKIVGAVNNANQNYWGSSGDLTGDDQEDIIEDSLNSLVSDVSGELHENAVFQHLDTAENIFLDFFRNKQNESFYDLIISWDTLSPVITMFGGSVTVSSGQSIINGDSINISQLCRENPELAKIQQYIRIIFNFSCLIALLWQIYNLILSTLGIDNPYLYEDADVTDVVNSDTGEVRTYYRTRKRYYKKR